MNTILRKQFLAHVGQTSPEPMMIEVARAEGVFFYTPEGKRYYDLVAGVSVSNVGHANPAVVRAVQEQAARYMHVMVYGELVETPQVEYAARIASLLPDPLESVYFVNSGAEAVEGALKLAKRYTGRTEMISMRCAYHGSTHGAMSMMGAPEGEEWKGAFRPLLPDTRAIRFNCMEDLRQITRRTACVLCEPVQGEAGVRPPQKGYLEALRRRCDEVGAMLIFDEIQTGMGRTGFDVHDDSHLDEMIEALSLPHLNFTGVFTHFAVSDEYGDPYTQLQFSRFTHAIERMEQATGHHFAIRHCANSGAVINYPEMHLDMVRPGLLLYGVFPAKETGGLDLRPAMSLYSRVSDVTHHHKGDTISYGRTFTCPRDMRLAVLPVGYADGLLRSLSGKGDVLLHGQRAPQVGRICMDMCMIDVTDLPEVKSGDEVEIFGEHILCADDAALCDTIPYELMCAVSKRVPRVYRLNGVPVDKNLQPL